MSQQAQHTPGPVVANGMALELGQNGNKDWLVIGTTYCEENTYGCSPLSAKQAEENAHRMAVCWSACEGIDDPAQLRAQRDELLVALEELIEVADLRGDSNLPHPADDRKLWTARMQTAWDDARAAIAKAKGT